MQKPNEPETFNESLGMDLRIKVVDVGANPIDGDSPYSAMVRAGDAELVGFDPNPDAFLRLNDRKGPTETYLPLAIGDGTQRMLYVCQAPGMTSLLRPNMAVLRHFHGFNDWAVVTGLREVQTIRLDDVPQTEGARLLQLDIQGAELLALQNATERLKHAVVVQVEVEFLQMYIDQPLFGDIDAFLRQQGFVFHRFLHTESRIVKPAALGKDLFAGLSQTLWGDAIFIKDFINTDAMADEDLLALAMIMHDCYRSYDITVAMLAAYDRRRGVDELVGRYLPSLRAETARRAA